MQLPFTTGSGLAWRGLIARMCLLVWLGACSLPGYAADDQASSTIKHDAAAANKYIKDHAHAVGEAVSHDAKAVGHAVAEGARTTGHVVSEDAKKVGKATRDAAHNAKASVTHD